MDTLPFLLYFLIICSNPTNGQKPNILLIMADDLGIGDVGCFGNNTIRTPNIDRLAKEGVKLTHHISAAPLCSPSRSAFQTGRYPIRTGMTGHSGYEVLLWNAASGGLPSNETTFAKILKQQGYSTGIIGKWHLGINCESRNDFCHHPLNHGFDYFFGTPFTLINDCEASRPSEMLLNYKKKMTFYAQIFTITVLTLLVIKLSHLIIIPWKLFIFAFFGSIFFLYWYVALAFLPHWNCILMRNFDIVEQPMDLELKVSQIVEEAKAFITRNKNGPFLLFVSFLHIHTPHYTTKRFKGRSKHDLYGDNIEEMDWMVGEILEAIDKEGLVNNTFTYFTSDHGAYLEGMDGSPHLKGHNGIYRGEILEAIDKEGIVNNTFTYFTSDHGAHLEGMEGSPHLKGHNGIYRGGKGMGGLEGGIRVPGILRWPGIFPTNTSVDKPTSLMDIFTTVTKLGGGTLPQDRTIDGKDLMPLVQGTVPNSEHEFMFHYCDDYLHSVRWHDTSSNTTWKVHYISPKFPAGANACYGSKLCSCSGENVAYHIPPLLFNLSNDPFEANPLPNDSVFYKEVLQKTQLATAHHNATLHPVPQQLYGLKNIWDPRLQLCCGTFPFCWCNNKSRS